MNEWYERYLRFVFQDSERLDRLFLCGGYTDRSIEKSEAEVMRDHLISLGVPKEKMSLEQHSYDTVSNLRNVANMIRRLSPDYDEVVIFCEGSRNLEIMEMSWWLFKRRRVVPFESSDWSIRSIVRTYLQPLDILLFHTPPLHWVKLWWKRRKAGVRA